MTDIEKREIKNINRQIETQKKKCKVIKGQLDENIDYLFKLIEEKDNLADAIVLNRELNSQDIKDRK